MFCVFFPMVSDLLVTDGGLTICYLAQALWFVLVKKDEVDL